MYYFSKNVIIWVEIMHIWFSILFGLCFIDVFNFWIVHFTAVIMPNFFFTNRN
jgi:uncharacterized membrane protein YagU involved in acid resistance